MLMSTTDALARDREIEPRPLSKTHALVYVKPAYYLEIPGLDTVRFLWDQCGLGQPSILIADYTWLLRREWGGRADTRQAGTHLTGLRAVRTLPEVQLVFGSGIFHLMLIFEGATCNVMGHGIAFMRDVMHFERTVQGSVVIAGP